MVACTEAGAAFLSDGQISRSSRLAHISQLHAHADDRCQRYAHLVVQIVHRLLASGAFEFDASLCRDGQKPHLQDFPAGELKCKMPTANVIVARVEDTMDVLLGRHLFEHLILPLVEQIFINNLIPYCLPCKPSSFTLV